MLKNRIIPCLDVKNGRVVKGINFVELKDAGDPVEQAKIYSESGRWNMFFRYYCFKWKSGSLIDIVKKLPKNTLCHWLLVGCQKYKKY